MMITMQTRGQRPRSGWQPTGRLAADQPGTWFQSLPAVTFSVVYVALLLVVPARLAIAQIGAPGTLASLWGISCLALWALATIGGWNPYSWSPTRVGVLAFAMSVGASYAAGHFAGWYQPADVQQALGQGRRWQLVSMDELTVAVTSAGDRGLLAMAGWLGILLITAEGMRSWRDLELLATWVVRVASVVAALGIVQYFTGLNVASYIQIPGLSPLSELATFERSTLNRVVSTAQHPIELGVAMAALLPLALHRSIHNRRIVAWVPTALIGLMVLMSVSRSAMIVAGGAVLVLFLGWPNRRRLWFLAGIPVVALAARAAFPGLLGTIQGLFAHFGDDPSIDARTADYAIAIRMFLENPVFGKGLFTWVPLYYRTLDNQVLVILLELGVVGMLTFFALIAIALFSGVGCRWRGADERSGHLGLSIAAGLLGMTLSYVTFDTLGFRQAAGVTFLLVGMAGAAWNLSAPPAGLMGSREVGRA